MPRPSLALRLLTRRSLARLSLSIVTAAALTGCAVAPAPDARTTQQYLDRLLPADALLLGEQHDAPDHQRVHLAVVQTLAARGALAALALEMAEQGRSTQGLARAANEDAVRAALQWDNAGWPWSAYGPAVMAAVHAGVPVLGANLPRAQMRTSMTDRQLDVLLPGPALKAQQQLIRLGHCEMLPENQISPMTRVQIARDVAMAHSVQMALVPGQTVVLLTGRGHADRNLGIPRHLSAALRVKTVGIGGQQPPSAVASTSTSPSTASFDLLWPAAPGPDTDHCASFKARLSPAGQGVRPAS